MAKKYDTPEPVLRARIKELETQIESLETYFRRHAAELWKLKILILELRTSQVIADPGYLSFVKTETLNKICDFAKVEVC